MKYLTVLDFSTGEVKIYSYPEDDERTLEEILEANGHKESDCQWMATDNLLLTVTQSA